MNKKLRHAEIFDLTFSLYKKTFLQQIIYSLLVNVVVGIISFVLVFVGVMAFLPSIIGLASGGSGSVAFITQIAVVIIVLYALMILLFSFTPVGSYVITHIKNNGGRPDIWFCFVKTFKSIPRVLSVMLCQVLIMLPFLLVLGGGIAALVYLMFSVNFTGDMFVIYLVSSIILALLLICVYIYFSVSWICSPMLAVFEKISFFRALKESKRMVKGDFKSIFGLVVVWLLVTMAFSYMLTGGVSILLGGATGFATATNNTGVALATSMLVNVLSLLLSTFVTVLIQPLTYIFSYVVYANLKTKKYGYDLECELDKILLEYRKDAYEN